MCSIHQQRYKTFNFWRRRRCTASIHTPSGCADTMHQKRGYYAYDPNLICSKLVFGIFTEKSRELFWLGKADMLSRQKQSTQKTINSISHYMPRRRTHVEKLGIVLHRKHTSHAHAFTTDASNWCEDCSLINKIFARKISFVVFLSELFLPHLFPLGAMIP